MLNDYYKHEPSMCNDSTGVFGECSSAKRSRTSDSEQLQLQKSLANWSLLPDIIIHEIFDNLNFTDRTKASSVCKHWRRNLYHWKLWNNVTFTIEPDKLDKARYFISGFGKIVTHATIKIHTLSTECMEEFVTLIKMLAINRNLRSLIIEPSHCGFEFHPKKIVEKKKSDSFIIVKSITACLSQLNRFSIGCTEELSNEVENFLEILSNKYAEEVELLGLASVKDEPGKCRNYAIRSSLFKPFTGLKILSIDYDELCNDFLNNLENATNLKRLIVHLHSIRSDHPGTCNKVWENFKSVHPTCELRLTLIHAFKDISNLHTKVLRKQMPLSHLKVFFCENVNLSAIECLSDYYRNTLKSLIWVDSLSQTDKSWAMATPFYETPDPFLLMSWLCTNLEEIIIHGYKYYEENLIAIARLRGSQLKILEIANDDILYHNSESSLHKTCLEDIPLNLKRPWAPISNADLHPVLCNPTYGDSDEYLLPIVLADLQ